MKTPTKEQLADPKWWDENAPEGATHFNEESKSCEWSWVKRTDDMVYYAYYSGVWREWPKGINFVSHWIPRSAAQWRGPEDGLPEAGELVYCGTHNRDVEILKTPELVPYVSAPCRALDNSELFWGGEFRPIRTPEQIAGEEREKVVMEMLSDDSLVINSIRPTRVVCETWYDAGYRKC